MKVKPKMVRNPSTGWYERQTRKVTRHGIMYTLYRAYNAQGRLIWVTIPE